MTQFHLHQHGIFLATTNAQDREPWCVSPGIPEIIISNLLLTKRIQHAKIYAFCILPDHLHVILLPGERGLSAFMKSFKENSSREIRRYRKAILNASNVSGDAVVSADPRSADPNAITNHFEYHGIFHGWQHGFHAQRIAQEKIFKRSIQYVEANAKRHELAQHPRDWPWTSLHFGRVMDPMESLPFMNIP